MFELLLLLLVHCRAQRTGKSRGRRVGRGRRETADRSATALHRLAHLGRHVVRRRHETHRVFRAHGRRGRFLARLLQHFRFDRRGFPLDRSRRHVHRHGLVGTRVLFHFRVERADAARAATGPAAAVPRRVFHHYAGRQVTVLTALFVIHLLVAAAGRFPVFAGGRARAL